MTEEFWRLLIDGNGSKITTQGKTAWNVHFEYKNHLSIGVPNVILIRTHILIMKHGDFMGSMCVYEYHQAEVGLDEPMNSGVG